MRACIVTVSIVIVPVSRCTRRVQLLAGRFRVARGPVRLHIRKLPLCTRTMRLHIVTMRTCSVAMRLHIAPFTKETVLLHDERRTRSRFTRSVGGRFCTMRLRIAGVCRHIVTRPLDVVSCHQGFVTRTTSSVPGSRRTPKPRAHRRRERAQLHIGAPPASPSCVQGWQANPCGQHVLAQEQSRHDEAAS